MTETILLIENLVIGNWILIGIWILDIGILVNFGHCFEFRISDLEFHSLFVGCFLMFVNVRVGLTFNLES